MPAKLSPLEIMTKLISFPTVSRDTNLPLIDWVEAYLGDHGIPSHRWPDPDQPHKAALFAHVGPWEEGAVVLSGHTDVVPVDGQPWDSDPFTVVEKAGKYFGRGACDMKGFDALAIWAVVEALARSLTGDNGSHVVSYGTEAGQFQRAGYSAVICGPGDIAQAHQPNEFITVAQFNAGHGFMKQLIERLAA